MYKHNFEDALKTHKAREAERKVWDDVWDEIAYFVLPSQTGFTTEFVPGERERWSHRFDSTAPHANKTLANHLHMSLVSPSKPWFDAKTPDKDLDKQDVVREWFEDCTGRMYAAFSESNFNAQINTLFQGFCAFGTAGMDVNFEQTPKNPFTLLFRSLDIGCCTFDYDGSFKIDTKCEEFIFTKRQMQELFETDFDSDNASEDKIKVLKITRPNPDYVEDSLNPKERAYIIEWCHKKELFKTESAYEQPFMVARVSQIKQDAIYGEGYALDCLSDIRSINRAKRLEFRSYEKGIDPPLMGAANAVLSDLQTQAGGYTIVRNPAAIGELPGRMDLQMVMTKGEELRDSIRRSYKIDEIIVPERKGQNPATATEIQVRYEQAQKALGAAVGRIEDELLTPMLERVFGLMMRNGRFLPMPEELSGAPVEIVFIGPLPKAQMVEDAVAIERAMQTGMGIAQLTGQPSKVMDYDKAERMLYDRYGVPASVTRSEDEVKKIEAQERKAAEQQAQQENDMANAQVQEQQATAETAQVELLQNVRGM